MSRPRRQVATCTVGDCGRPAVARTWCTMHYSRWERTGTTDAPTRNRPQPKTCTADGCDRDAAARTWCDLHYHRWRQHGDPLHVEPRPTRKPCIIDGCDQPNKSFGYCNKHYKRWKKHGDPLVGAQVRKPRVEAAPSKPPVDVPDHLAKYLERRRKRQEALGGRGRTITQQGGPNGMRGREMRQGRPESDTREGAA